MSELLEQTIAEVRKLSDSEQDAAAIALIEHLDRQDIQLSDEQLAEARRRMDDPEQVLVSYEDALKHFGLADS